MEFPREEPCTLSEIYTLHHSLSLTQRELWVSKSVLFYTGAQLTSDAVLVPYAQQSDSATYSQASTSLQTLFLPRMLHNIQHSSLWYTVFYHSDSVLGKDISGLS